MREQRWGLFWLISNFVLLGPRIEDLGQTITVNNFEFDAVKTLDVTACLLELG
jgi:hypothetical protein